MAKIKLILILSISFFLITFRPVWAADKYMAPVFPIRGTDNWGLNSSPSAQTQNLLDVISAAQVPATWLVRYDAMRDPQINQSLKSRLPQEDVGLFLEITESLAQDAGVPYQASGQWYDANKVFLSGYSINERINLIDEIMNKFLSIYGYFPHTVGAWHIDAYSAKYLSQKYGVTGFILCADQYSTDKYQLWGSFWGVPYIPSEHNLLMPAADINSRIPVVVGQWAARDAFNGYGLSAHQSTYSLQANDYLPLGLDINYFQKLASSYLDNPNNRYGFMLIGIENDYPFPSYGSQVTAQIAYAKTRAQANELKIVTFSQFSDWYLNNFFLSPNHEIKLTDPLGTGNSARWEMTTHQRQGFVTIDRIESLRDFRLYDPLLFEPFLVNKNPYPNLYHTIPAQIDTALGITNSTSSTFSSQWPTYHWWEYSIVLLITFIILCFTFKQFLLPLLITTLSTLWSLPLIRSGQLMPYGLGFWGPNGHDAIWHLSIANHFSHHLSLHNPLLSGSTLQNYHFIFDLLLGFLSRIFHLSLISLYFHILPFVMAITISILVWYLVKKITNSNRSANFALLTTFTAGNAGWLVTFVNSRSIGGETMFWAQQAISTLINPPFALSLIFLLLSLLLIHSYSQTPSFRKLFITSLLIALLVQTKIYANLLLLGSLSIFVLKELYFNRKKLVTIKWSELYHSSFLPLSKLFFTSSVLSLLLILPFTNFNSSSGFPFVWHPFWFITTLVQDTDHFYWPRMARALQAYSATSAYPKLLLALSLTSLVFFIGNFWTRVIGVIFSILKLKHSGFLSQFMFVIFALGVIFPLLFIQSGTAWNTIQFMYYSLFIASIWTGVSLAYIRPHFLAHLFLFLIVAINLPSSYGTLKHYLPSRAPSRVPVEELQALTFLQSQLPGNILTYPYQANSRSFDVPLPLAVYTSTAYVSALSSHPTILEDQINLDLMGLDWRTKRNQIMTFFYTQSISQARKFISDNQVSYIYLLPNDPAPSTLHELGSILIYDNGLVKIFHIPDPQLQ